MIFNTDIKEKRKSNYETAIDNFEKAKEVLDTRYQKKQVENNYYIKTEHSIQAQIDKYKQKINKE